MLAKRANELEISAVSRRFTADSNESRAKRNCDFISRKPRRICGNRFPSTMLSPAKRIMRSKFSAFTRTVRTSGVAAAATGFAVFVDLSEDFSGCSEELTTDLLGANGAGCGLIGATKLSDAAWIISVGDCGCSTTSTGFVVGTDTGMACGGADNAVINALISTACVDFQFGKSASCIVAN